MCGFAGIISGRLSEVINDHTKNEISKTLKYRGPDSEGFFLSDDDCTIMIHRRLSILDLSDKGSQPMTISSGRFTIVFNGEIYNHQELRNDESVINLKWEGSSDTETLIKFFEANGIDKTLKSIEGMFSFAIYDKHLNKIYLARDRSGEKPLLYGKINDIFVFGSELSFLKKIPNLKLNLDKLSINQYFFYGYTKETPFREIKKIQPGCYLEVFINSDGSTDYKKTKNYWNFDLSKNLRKFGTSEIEKNFEKKLLKVINKQMISDVPIGAFLSSGLDSSLIVSMMSKYSKNKLKTFTVGFENDLINESHEAKKISDFLKTDHHEIFLSDKKIANLIPDIFNYFDFPISDPSIIPTYLVSYIAKDHVKVALSGDGGDELFLGYKRYAECKKIEKKIKFTPKLLRVFLNFLISNSPQKVLNSINFSENKLRKLKNILSDTKSENIYQNIICKSFPELILKEHHNYEDYKINLKKKFTNLYEYMSVFDFQNYLPNDILYKIDICSMRNSLETRVPFLDKEILEFVENLPTKYKIDKNNDQKIIIKKVLQNYLPYKYINKKKLGFGLHLNILLKTSLLDWVESLLDFLKQNNDQFLDYKLVKRYWEMFKKNEQISEHFIWNILSYLAWKKNWQNKVYF